MFASNGVSGKKLVDTTTMVLVSYGYGSEDEMRQRVVEVYSRNEYFDGEPIDPKAFADRIADAISKGRLNRVTA